MIRIGGIDEAGRGSILGPLVIAGVSTTDEKLNKIVKLGVKDSKLLTRKRRTDLYTKIINVADKIQVFKIPPEEIDRYVINGKKLQKLNYLEAITMAKVLNKLDVDQAYVDASDVNPNRFKCNILEYLNKNVQITSTHHADRIYPIVSAASIIAKVERDYEIKILIEKYGDFGSGYPSDNHTRNYLIEWMNKNDFLPDFSRKSWKTFSKLKIRTLDNLLG